MRNVIFIFALPPPPLCHQWLLLPCFFLVPPAWEILGAGLYYKCKLELPPVADPGALPTLLPDCGRLPTQRGGFVAAGSCWDWLTRSRSILSQPGLEIQHCTWGAMCVPSLSPLINLSPDPPLSNLFSPLPFKITFLVHVCVHKLIALDATCRRWTLLTWLPQVPIPANSCEEAKMMWNFPNDEYQKKKKKVLPFQSQLDLVRIDLFIWKWLNELFHPMPM